MSTANWTRLAQSVIAALNVGHLTILAMHVAVPPALTISLAMATAGFQMYVHESGVQTPPPEK